MKMYQIIELKEYDVLLPFVCHNCGSCCRGFAPQIPIADFPRIAQHVGKSIEEIERQHSEAYSKKFTDSPIDCSFLNNNNQCSIYPMRPEPCRLYPLKTDFGTAGVNCIGYKEFHAIVDAFFARRKYAALWRSDSYRKPVRPIPRHQLTVVWKTFIKAKPSSATIRRFVKLNKIPIDHMREPNRKHAD